MRTSHIFKNLQKGQLYRFAYRVKNINGWSSLSEVTAIRAAIFPGQPKAPELLSASATLMSLQFFQPKDNGGSAIISYKLFRNDGTDITEPEILVSSYTSNQMLYTLQQVRDNLQTGLIYKFKFRATNEVGNSEDSSIVEYALVDVPIAPSAPEIMLGLTGEKQIAVNWDPIVSN